MIRVVSMRGSLKPAAEGVLRLRIDRATALGNPFRIEQGVATRKDVVDTYRKWVMSDRSAAACEARTQIRQIIKLDAEGHRIELACWCSPLPCHGDVIKELVVKARKELASC